MRRLRYALTAAGIAGLVIGPMSMGSSAATLDQSNLPNAMHAEVENKAVILGTGAQGLFVDPGPAYSLANIDYTRYSEENFQLALKARGAVLDPGTIGGAVLWAAPTNAPITDSACNTQCKEVPTGLHEASGFPGYAEAFYPDANSLDRQHTAKCLWNKDAAFANPTGGALQDTCRNDAEAAPAYAVADTWSDRLESRGFTRAAGATGSTLLSVGASEAMSNVKPTADGSLIAKGYASAKNIVLANGVITIGKVKATGEIDTKAGSGAPDVAKAACTADSVNVAGVDLPVDAGSQINPAQFKPLHDAARDRGFEITIIPPSKPVITTDAVGKHTVSCTGLQVIIDDVRQGIANVGGTNLCSPSPAPQIPGAPHIPDCVPAGSGLRLEYTFGAIKINAAASDFDVISVDDTSDAAGAPTSEAAIGTGFGSDDGGLSSSLGGSSVPSVLGSSIGAGSGTPSSSSGTPRRRAGTSGTQVAGTTSLGGPKPVSRTTVAALTTATAAAIGGGVWLLIGVVMALATGSRLRLPGTRIR